MVIMRRGRGTYQNEIEYLFEKKMSKYKGQLSKVKRGTY